MSGFQEADDNELDAVRALLPAPAAELGQLVWWSDPTGSSIYEGRICRIDLGYYGYTIDEDSVSRQYVAASERVMYFNAGRNDFVWSESKASYEKESFSGERDWWHKLCWTFEDACKKGAAAQERWAGDADRDAQLRRERAATLLALSVKAEAA